MLSTQVVDLCEQEATPKQEEFLHRVLTDEIERRERNRKTRLLTKAGFPTLKSFGEYEFTAIRFPPALSKEELLSIDFIAEKKNLVLYGAVGTGKTLDERVHVASLPRAARLLAGLMLTLDDGS